MKPMIELDGRTKRYFARRGTLAANVCFTWASACPTASTWAWVNPVSVSVSILPA